jgi:hypothetical protein
MLVNCFIISVEDQSACCVSMLNPISYKRVQQQKSKKNRGSGCLFCMSLCAEIIEEVTLVKRGQQAIKKR